MRKFHLTTSAPLLSLQNFLRSQLLSKSVNCSWYPDDTCRWHWCLLVQHQHNTSSFPTSRQILFKSSHFPHELVGPLGSSPHSWLQDWSLIHFQPTNSHVPTVTVDAWPKLANQTKGNGCSDTWDRDFALFCWIWIGKYLAHVTIVSPKMKPKQWKAEKRDSKNLGLWWQNWAAGSINPRNHPISGITVSRDKKSPYRLCQLRSFFLLLGVISILLILLKFLSLAQNCPLSSRLSILDHSHQYKISWNSSCVNRNSLDCSSQLLTWKLLESDVCSHPLYLQVHSLLLPVQSSQASPTCPSCHTFW